MFRHLVLKHPLKHGVKAIISGYCRNTELARSVDVMMTQATIIKILTIEINKLVSFLYLAEFSNR